MSNIWHNKRILYNFFSPSETLRLHTVVPTLIRQCAEDYVVPGYPQYKIAKGMSVMVAAGALHRDPTIYARPTEFYPEHFAPDQVAARETASFLAFGDGPRNCIGARFGKLQSRIGLALLVKNYRLSLGSQTPKKLEADIKSFMMAPDGDIVLRVENI